MNLSSLTLTSILASLIFSSIGLIVLRMGKRDANMRAIALGLALMLYSYFIQREWVMWAAGVGLSVLSLLALRDSD